MAMFGLGFSKPEPLGRTHLGQNAGAQFRQSMYSPVSALPDGGGDTGYDDRGFGGMSGLSYQHMLDQFAPTAFSRPYNGGGDPLHQTQSPGPSRPEDFYYMPNGDPWTGVNDSRSNSAPELSYAPPSSPGFGGIAPGGATQGTPGFGGVSNNGLDDYSPDAASMVRDAQTAMNEDMHRAAGRKAIPITESMQDTSVWGDDSAETGNIGTPTPYGSDGLPLPDVNDHLGKDYDEVSGKHKVFGHDGQGYDARLKPPILNKSGTGRAMPGPLSFGGVDPSNLIASGDTGGPIAFPGGERVGSRDFKHNYPGGEAVGGHHFPGGEKYDRRGAEYLEDIDKELNSKDPKWNQQLVDWRLQLMREEAQRRSRRGYIS